ncbi:hypothetical protein OPT61_g4451 [Boeremia exigua]|uniref:Uncharacterized protein n=1 Tax=Boeremia exigua TaxID=749465 RepID=A0ACC2IE11_9PLEO|nr:hypothetical protein OPT61_g4451 [Boeremia exigua]
MTSHATTRDESAIHESTYKNTTRSLVVVPLDPPSTQAMGAVSSAHSSIRITPSSSASPLSTSSISRDRPSVENDESNTTQGNPLNSGLSGQLNPQEYEFAWNVYAKSWVPPALQAVNEEPTDHVIVTRTKHKIDYRVYIKTLAGSDLLISREAWNQEWPDESQSLSTELTEESYMCYFAMLLRREYAAKRKENEQYALYKVLLQAVPATHSPLLWALSVPGLREDSPSVEMGDTLQIRQLYVDQGGNIFQVPALYPRGSGSRAVYQCWTGQQYDASVNSVSRVNEVVYLRVDDLKQLTSHYALGFLPMAVNVVFPIRNQILQSQRRALSFVSRSLESSQCKTQDLDKPSNNAKSVTKSQDMSDVTQNDWMRKMLFPTEAYGRLQTTLRSVPQRALFDHAINYEQAHAVNSVCEFDYGTVPYIISGPPGTGKTKTLVETAMQLLQTTTVAHILICAPSEAAVDTLAMRIKNYLSPKQLLRLNAPSRADNEVPRELLQYSFMENDMFYLPPFKKLLSFNVVVTSCRDAAMLAEARLTNSDLWTLEREMVSAFHPEDELPIPNLHWGALLLDEAAQATEVDVLSAISVIDPPSAYPQDCLQPSLVMAGDEHQLGPRTASHDPAYSMSLFARLSSQPLYANHPLSRSKVKPSSGPPVLKRSMLPILCPPFTNLIRNYRSHPAILSIPSSLFYHDTLIPEAAFSDTRLRVSTVWRGREWPVLYLPHIGSDEIERENGGWYNISEARLACSIAQRLVFEDGVEQEDICIMSPFAAQVKLLRSMIRTDKYAGGIGLWDVNIGPVEAFQGLEKRVVIICTTRTRQRFVDEDVRRGMGLVHQQRKMNVALTRAKEALFMIGSPAVLGADEHWREWMMFCGRNGLVDDPLGVWKDRGQSQNGKIGVLERALIAKEEGMRDKQWPALGAAAADYDVDGGEYEAWTESLRMALEEEDGTDDEGYDDEDEPST